MSDVLAFAERREGRIGGMARETVGVAARIASGLGGRAHALVIGEPGASREAAALGEVGASVVQVGEHDLLGDYNPEAFTAILCEKIREGGYAAVVLPASALGRDLGPRVAALLDVPLATDATKVDVVDGSIVIERPVYSGKAFARIEIDALPVLVSIRPNAFPPVGASVPAEVMIFTPSVDPEAWRVRVLERKEVSGGTLDVSEASIVVSGGRGMRDPENWTLLEGLRDALGSDAALGASRAVVDAGWRPHGEQVGQTGKTVAPKLYVAVGISGAIQHLAGMRTSATIVAINKDPAAPIFSVADYGIVGDLFEVVPRLSQEIARLRAGD